MHVRKYAPAGVAGRIRAEIAGPDGARRLVWYNNMR